MTSIHHQSNLYPEGRNLVHDANRSPDRFVFAKKGNAICITSLFPSVATSVISAGK